MRDFRRLRSIGHVGRDLEGFEFGGKTMCTRNGRIELQEYGDGPPLMIENAGHHSSLLEDGVSLQYICAWYISYILHDMSLKPTGQSARKV